jgi:hypothetical protein
MFLGSRTAAEPLHVPRLAQLGSQFIPQRQLRPHLCTLTYSGATGSEDSRTRLTDPGFAGSVSPSLALRCLSQQHKRRTRDESRH